jgi:hypothetical protein
MIPWGPLDGAKVKDWNDTAFWVVIGVFGLLVFSWVFTNGEVWNPKDLLNSIADLF